ncbi:uncharacterized protein LOC126605887 isoform X2 [Malus sylvestris]|uniref:uncharacterized protein LOC126605887 isoform X2 n=1 Tax=Malus sylvestris TaxID=3752 RepID=UPI0021AC0399|nr:uncharacterized protein LOC126605887 isoform X2 [Malus sylvestris]
MSSTQLSDQIVRPLIPAACVSFRQLSTTKPKLLPCPRPKFLKHKHFAQKSKWAVRLSLVDQSPPKSAFDVEQLVGFLYEDLVHLFDDRGIDRTAYDERVKFRDPITKHDTITGYLLNIAFLKIVFTPRFQLHWVKRTGPYEITTRWTMVMKFIPLPWKPELIFTGTSVMGINPETGKFCSHVLRIYKTPDLETPKYEILKRTANYEVRKYAPYLVVEGPVDKLSGSAGFGDVTGYIFGKNSKMEKIPMTTPVFTEASDAELSKVSIKLCLPLDKDISSLPDPNQETISLKKVEGGIAAVVKFSGKPTEEIVREKEKVLRASLIRDGLKPKEGCSLARYNDPGRTWSFMLRNEVLIGLEEFTLD